MITRPCDAAANGLPTTVRDKGAWAMFAGTPYSYLHIVGTPWEGTGYHKAIRQSGPCLTLLAEPREAKSSRRTTHPTSRKRS
jgi:hypothetical protein